MRIAEPIDNMVALDKAERIIDKPIGWRVLQFPNKADDDQGKYNVRGWETSRQERDDGRRMAKGDA